MAAESDTLASPPWRGFHHVALVTRDLDATMRFYDQVLGMEVGSIAPATELHGRHCAIRPGSQPDRLGLHFSNIPTRHTPIRTSSCWQLRSLILAQPFSRIFRLPCRTNRLDWRCASA